MNRKTGSGFFANDQEMTYNVALDKVDETEIFFPEIPKPLKPLP